MSVQVYLVGGAVRDKLLGHESKDRDYVVVGATPEHMLKLGFQQVGADFPVFLEPRTGEEYALARTERKTGPGYTGFTVDASPEVTLEEDLRRRDLTINSMALKCELGGAHIADISTVIDPFGGAQDLASGVLRHTSEAFAEDPLRVFRLARFAARFDFRVCHETLNLCTKLVSSGELNELTPERVWKEVNRALMEPYAHRFFDVLATVKALKNTHFMAEVFNTTTEHATRVLTMSKALSAPVEVRLALLTHPDTGAFKQDLKSTWLAVTRTELLWKRSPTEIFGLLESVRAFHQNEKLDLFFTLVNVMELLGQLPHGFFKQLIASHEAAKQVRANVALEGAAIGRDLKARRLLEVKRAMGYLT